jgi:hypothetical protein
MIPIVQEIEQLLLCTYLDHTDYANVILVPWIFYMVLIRIIEQLSKYNKQDQITFALSTTEISTC